MRRLFKSFRLRSKLIASFLAVALIPLLILTYIDRQSTQRILTENANQSLLAAANQTANSVDAFIDTNLSIVRVEAILPGLSSYLDLPDNQRLQSAEEQIARATLLSLSRKDTVNIFSYALLDLQGRNVLDTFTPAIGRDESDQSYFIQPLKTGYAYASNLLFSSLFPQIATVYFSAPVRDAAGNLLGVLRVCYNATVIQQIIARQQGLGGPKSFALLLDEHHIRLASGQSAEFLFKSIAPLPTAQVQQLITQGRLPQRAAARLTTNHPELKAVLSQINTPTTLTSQLEETANQTAAIAIAPLKTQPWQALFVQSEAVFLAPIQAQIWSALLLAVPIAAATTIAAIAVGRLLSDPILQLTKAVSQFTAGDLPTRLPIRSQDEIGELATAFNDMTVRLRTYTEELESRNTEILSLNRTLEQRVAQRTAQLAHAEAELRALFEAMTELIFVFDAAGYCQKIVSNNPNLLIGTPEDKVGQRLHDLYPQERADWFLDCIQQSLTTQAPINIEYSEMMGDREVWSAAILSPISDNFVLWVVRDVTERKLAEKALRQSEATNRAIIQAIPDLLIRVRPDGTILSTTGIEKLPAGLELSHVNDLPFHVAQQQMRYIQRALYTGEVQVYEQQLLKPDGELHDEEVRIAVIDQDEVLMIVRDVTDRKQAEIALQQSLIRIAEANQEITSLNQCLETENLRMSAELAVTRQLQCMILPKERELKQIRDLDIAGFMEPAEEVAGDYYDVLQQDGHVIIGIGDVAGHGLESGVLMLMVQTAIRTLQNSSAIDPKQFLNILNYTIHGNLQRMNCDKSLTLMLIDYREGRLLISGQHEELLVVRSQGTVERINTLDLGVPLGLEVNITQFFNQIEVQLQAGDGIVLYTDGITEARNAAKQEYGVQRLCRVVGEHWQRSTDEICQAVIQDHRSYLEGTKVTDDMTLLVLKQRETA
jgi:PAS domain S-box-containing protein